jgi:hypothetical protein
MPRKSKSRSSKMRGGRVSLPAEYYGGISGRYHDAGSADLATCANAYGRNVAVSHGVVHPTGGIMGPNLGPSPISSFVQTGGAKNGKKAVRFNNPPPRRRRSGSRTRRLRTRNKTPPSRRRRRSGSKSKSRSRSRSRSRSPNKRR